MDKFGLNREDFETYKDYRKAYIKAHKQSDKARASQKAYRQTDKVKAYMKAYEQTDKYKDYQKAYRQTDKYKTCRKAYNKAYQQSDEYKAYQKAYEQSEHGRSVSRAKAAKRRAAKLERTVGWSDLQKIRQFYLDCPEGCHIDHIVPLQGELVSGLHVLSNLQYLTAEENMSKSNKFTI